MISLTLDNPWFYRERASILGHPLNGEAAAMRSFRTVRAVQRGSALTPDSKARDALEKTLDRMAPRHATAVRGHMQFFQACVESMGLAPASALVNAAVQVEWIWFVNPFKFYRDHLAHVMKVATSAMVLWKHKSPLSPDAPLIDTVAVKLAAREYGSPALRGMARRLGVSEDDLATEKFWKQTTLEATRIAGLLHDLDYPSMMGRKVHHAAHVADFHASFETKPNKDDDPALPWIEHSLLATPFNRGRLLSERLDDSAREACLRVLELTHSLPAGIRLLEFMADAEHLGRMHPWEIFVLHWAALASSMHDYDKLWSATKDKEPVLVQWRDADGNKSALQPSLTRDPVSWMVALCDQLQDFGRVNYGREPEATRDRVTFLLQTPWPAVTLTRDGNTVTIGWSLSDACPNLPRQKVCADKAKDATANLCPGGWIDSDGLNVRFKVDVQDPTAPASAP